MCTGFAIRLQALQAGRFSRDCRQKRPVTGLLCALLLASTAHADWIEASNQHTLHLLGAQCAFAPANLSGLGLAEFGGGVMDLKPRRYHREPASERKRLKEMREHGCPQQG